MNMSPRLRSRLRASAALAPASLVALLVCGPLNVSAGPGSTVPTDQASASAPVAGAVEQAATTRDVFLRFPDGSATVTLDDSLVARTFAAMLPLRLSMHDPMGQAKSAQLPSPIDVTDSEMVLDPRVGELYYWAPSHTVAVFYDDLDQSVPPRGLVRLGVVQSGLSAMGTAGNEVPVRIEIADHTTTLMGS